MTDKAAARTGLDRALIAIAAVVVLGAIMSILDTTIVNVAIDRLASDFHSPLSTIQWVSTGYMLALATVIPLTGWAADRFGTKRLYLASVALFLVGSALSGLAWSAGSLIVFRVLQGLGGGMIMPVSMTILTRAAGPQRVGRVMSVVGVPMLMGPVLGPVIGGWLVTDVSWRWIFYVNLPIGALALPLAYRVLKRDESQPGERLDFLGFALLSPGLGAFVYGLAEMSSAGLGSTKALAGTIVGALLIAAFARHSLRTEKPLIDLRLFRTRAVSASAATSFLFAGAFFGTMLLLPLYFQVVRGESALTAGLLLAPQGFGAAFAMPLAGRLTDERGAKQVVLVGLALVLLGTIAWTQVGAHSSYWLLGASLFVRGMGMGATMMPAMSAAYQGIAPAAIARATSALNILQRVGGSIGTAVLAVLLESAITSRIPQAHGGGIGAAQSVPAGVRHAITPALASAFGSTFTWALVISALAYVPAALMVRGRANAEEAQRALPATGPAAEPVAVEG